MSIAAPSSGPVGSHPDEVTTADLAAFANTADSVDLQQYVTSALDFVRGACGPITAGQWRFLLPQRAGGRRLQPPRWPAVRMASLDAVADTLGVDVLTQLTASTDINWRTGAILAPYQQAGLWTVTATLTRPAAATTALKLATVMVAKSLFELQRGKSARPSGYGQQDATAAPSWTSIPSRARDLMKPYLLRPVG